MFRKENDVLNMRENRRFVPRDTDVSEVNRYKYLCKLKGKKNRADEDYGRRNTEERKFSLRIDINDKLIELWWLTGLRILKIPWYSAVKEENDSGIVFTECLIWTQDIILWRKTPIENVLTEWSLKILENYYTRISDKQGINCTFWSERAYNVVFFLYTYLLKIYDFETIKTIIVHNKILLDEMILIRYETYTWI